MPKNWDDKIILKEELRKHSIPVPQFFELTFFDLKHKNIEQIFSKLERPVIIKPRVGSRARHTVTNINTLPHFKDALKVASQISAYLVVEEHINGFICRATLVDGKLAGFYKGSVPKVTGDGVKTIHELIQEKNAKQIERYHVKISNELHDHIRRFGFAINDVLPKDITISLSHRAGQLFGGMTTEMLDDLHPSFLPILEKAAKVVDLSIVGFDCLIPDPTKDSSTQKWAIIECNSLPFIDMHYYALEGKAKNIAGMIWDLWQRD
jgi:D-alanine-D-alanine ligase-like ATP-grasp enzyme